MNAYLTAPLLLPSNITPQNNLTLQRQTMFTETAQDVTTTMPNYAPAPAASDISCDETTTQDYINDSHDEVPRSSRLVRNRRTARLRREKKKKEAECLTTVISCETNVEQELRRRFLALPIEKQLKYENFENDTMRDDFAIGCLFCDSVIESESSVLQHYHSEHHHELKSCHSYLGSEIMNFLSDPDKLLVYVEHLSKESSQKVALYQGKASVNSNRGTFHPRLSSEEKRKRRLERNAESARLCRQRKKLYIHKLRINIPILKQKNKIMKSFLESQQACPIDGLATDAMLSPSFPKLTGWERNAKKPKRNLSFNTLNHPENNSVSKRPLLIHDQPTISPGVDLMANWNELVRLNTLLLQNSINVTNAILGQQNNLNPTINFMSTQSPNMDKEVFEAAYALTKLGTR